MSEPHRINSFTEFQDYAMGEFYKDHPDLKGSLIEYFDTDENVNIYAVNTKVYVHNQFPYKDQIGIGFDCYEGVKNFERCASNPSIIWIDCDDVRKWQYPVPFKHIKGENYSLIYDFYRPIFDAIAQRMRTQLEINRISKAGDMKVFEIWAGGES